MNKKFNIFLNARLGDGCINKTRSSTGTYNANFVSNDKRWLEVKRDLSHPQGKVYKIKPHKSRYGQKEFYQFSTRVHANWKKYKLTPIIELIPKLKIQDLVALYLDDGCFSPKRVMHLATHSLTLEENQALRLKIGNLLGEFPTIATERKKDGRVFNYLYFPRALTKSFIPLVEEFIHYHGLECFKYKIGICQLQLDLHVDSLSKPVLP